MGNSASYESISAALSALMYDISGQPQLADQTLNQILDSGIDLPHREELRRIIDANGLGEAKIVNTSWQANKDGKSYGSMNAATFELNGKIFVAYRGTGDGNWIYNADSAYGYEASDMQKWAAEYFDDVMKDRHNGQEVYVTGHSQGGNNAMYVTFFSNYRRYITSYYSIDGPGFSHEMIEQAKYLNGEEDYERLRQKGYAINGHEDFVHNLGEEHTTIQDDEHVKFVEARMDSPMGTHDIFSHFKKDGTLGDYRDEGAISKLSTELVERMKDQLSKRDRYEVGQAVMKLIENLNPGKDTLTINMGSEDLKNLKLLIPILVDVMAEQPELLETALGEFGLPVAYVDLVCTIINELNGLSPELRAQALETLLDCVVVNDDNSLGFDLSRIDGWTAVSAGIPLILETLAHHPDQAIAALLEWKADEKIVKLIKEHPAVAIALVICTPLLTLIVRAETVIILLDALYHIVKGVADVAKKIADFALNVFNAVKQAVGRLSEWLQSVWNAKGNNYVKENPWFKADPSLLRGYANRIANVNRRLRNLDRDMNSLYWQVGLLDLWDILCANLITSESWTLDLVKKYLNDTADRLENAERQAYQYMGG